MSSRKCNNWHFYCGCVNLSGGLFYFFLHRELRLYEWPNENLARRKTEVHDLEILSFTRDNSLRLLTSGGAGVCVCVGGRELDAKVYWWRKYDPDTKETHKNTEKVQTQTQTEGTLWHLKISCSWHNRGKYPHIQSNFFFFHFHLKFFAKNRYGCYKNNWTPKSVTETFKRPFVRDRGGICRPTTLVWHRVSGAVSSTQKKTGPWWTGHTVFLRRQRSVPGCPS